MSKYIVDGETMTGIADAIRAKNHSTELITPGQMPPAIAALEVEDDYEWRKPEAWPDLESVPLPGNWDRDTIYLLYDKSCGVDYVGIRLYPANDIYKGTIIDGAFVGDLVAQNVSKYEDILEQEYTVYKIVSASDCASKFNLALETKIGSSYTWNRQGLVWIYAELPLNGSNGGSSDTSWMTPWIKRIYLSHVNKPYFTFPSGIYYSYGVGGFDTSTSFVSGYEEPNDWGGKPIGRTGNGPITPVMKQKSDYVVKNANFQQSYAIGNITAKNVVLVNPSGVLKQQQYMRGYYIQKFVIKGGTLKCTSMNNQFSQAVDLHTCDMGDVDFSECTNWADAFYLCVKLKNLKLNSSCKYSINLSYSPLLTHDSIVGLFSDLPQIDTTQTLTLNSSSKMLLSPEEIAIATQKGWTVA